MSVTSKYGKRVRTLGVGFTQDKSIELLKNVKNFVSKNIELDEDEDLDPRVFVCRLALKPCFVLASNELVFDYLNKSDDSKFYNGLKDFFFGLFGQSVLFAEADEAKRLRAMLLPFFTDPDALSEYQYDMTSLTEHWMRHELLSEDVFLYTEFKRLTLAVNLKIFLGIDIRQDPEFFNEISALATNHWHGIISVPLNVKLAFASSSYRKAQDAKEKLLQIIKDKVEANEVDFLKAFKQCEIDPDLLHNHILVFICALIPKAVASILASFIDSAHLWREKFVNDDGEIDDEDLDCVYKEVLRLWPPFVGGLKVAKEDVNIGGYEVPKGHGVFYVSLMAHRDPKTFPYPEQFLPERWKTFNADDADKLFGFGSGLHRCPGEKYARRLIEVIAKRFIKTFDWEFNYKSQERTIKYLPVSRPAKLEATKIMRK